MKTVADPNATNSRNIPIQNVQVGILFLFWLDKDFGNYGFRQVYQGKERVSFENLTRLPPFKKETNKMSTSTSVVERVVNCYDELDLSNVQGRKLEKSWNFTNQEGKNIQGKQVFAELYQNNDTDQKLSIMFPDLKTRSGVYLTPDGKSALVSFELDTKQSLDIKQKCDDKLKAFLYEKRKTLFAGTALSGMHDPIMFMGYTGVLKTGKFKDEKDESKGRWNDVIPATLPTKKKGKQLSIDPNLCDILDEDSKEYSFMNLEGKTCSEVILELEKFVIKDATVVAKWNVRRLVVKGKDVPKLVSKRKLVQQQNAVTLDGTVAPSSPEEQPSTEPVSKKRALPGK
jgi:hypothetical protein